MPELLRLDNPDLILSYLPGGLEYKELSIILPTRNALDYLENCLKSIERFTDMEHNVIIVNDGSEDEKKIKEISDKYNTVLLSFYNMRLGFPLACNIGMSVANSEYICLLNTDTLVSPGWTDIFTKVLSRKDIGIAGPSTSAGASEQTLEDINIRRYDYKIDDMPKLSKYCKDKYKDEVQSINLVVGFCFCFKKELIDYIGYFDHKRFELGSSEELDYCLRARKMGFAVVWSQGQYCHHYGKVTFSKEMTKEEIATYWSRNFKRMNKKWEIFSAGQ